MDWQGSQINYGFETVSWSGNDGQASATPNQNLEYSNVGAKNFRLRATSSYDAAYREDQVDYTIAMASSSSPTPSSSSPAPSSSSPAPSSSSPTPSSSQRPSSSSPLPPPSSSSPGRSLVATRSPEYLCCRAGQQITVSAVSDPGTTVTITASDGDSNSGSENVTFIYTTTDSDCGTKIDFDVSSSNGLSLTVSAYVLALTFNSLHADGGQTRVTTYANDTFDVTAALTVKGQITVAPPGLDGLGSFPYTVILGQWIKGTVTFYFSDGSSYPKTVDHLEQLADLGRLFDPTISLFRIQGDDHPGIRGIPGAADLTTIDVNVSANLYMQYWCADSPNQPQTIGKLTWTWQGGWAIGTGEYGGIGASEGVASSEEPVPPYPGPP